MPANSNSSQSIVQTHYKRYLEIGISLACNPYRKYTLFIVIFDSGKIKKVEMEVSDQFFLANVKILRRRFLNRLCWLGSRSGIFQIIETGDCNSNTWVFLVFQASFLTDLVPISLTSTHGKCNCESLSLQAYNSDNSEFITRNFFSNHRIH